MRFCAKLAWHKTPIYTKLITNVRTARAAYFDKFISDAHPKVLEELLDRYISQIVKSNIHELNQRIYIFIDEIQYVDYWQDILKRYIEILKDAQLFYEIYAYQKSFRKQGKTQKKIYASSSNFIASTLNLNVVSSIAKPILGKLVESYVLMQLQKLFEQVSFIRKGANEIDFACGNLLHKNKSELVFIESKYKENIKKQDIKFLISYLEQNDLKQGFVISKNKIDIVEYNDTKIFFIPASCF